MKFEPSSPCKATLKNQFPALLWSLFCVILNTYAFEKRSFFLPGAVSPKNGFFRYWHFLPGVLIKKGSFNAFSRLFNDFQAIPLQNLLKMTNIPSNPLNLSFLLCLFMGTRRKRILSYF
ncbi:MAG: hypothetical protein QQN46_08655 [Nitrosopumilus sp.]